MAAYGLCDSHRLHGHTQLVCVHECVFILQAYVVGRSYTLQLQSTTYHSVQLYGAVCIPCVHDAQVILTCSS